MSIRIPEAGNNALHSGIADHRSKHALSHTVRSILRQNIMFSFGAAKQISCGFFYSKQTADQSFQIAGYHNIHQRRAGVGQQIAGSKFATVD